MAEEGAENLYGPMAGWWLSWDIIQTQKGSCTYELLSLVTAWSNHVKSKQDRSPAQRGVLGMKLHAWLRNYWQLLAAEKGPGFSKVSPLISQLHPTERPRIQEHLSSTNWPWLEWGWMHKIGREGKVSVNLGRVVGRRLNVTKTHWIKFLSSKMILKYNISKWHRYTLA